MTDVFEINPEDSPMNEIFRNGKPVELSSEQLQEILDFINEDQPDATYWCMDCGRCLGPDRKCPCRTARWN